MCPEFRFPSVGSPSVKQQIYQTVASARSFKVSRGGRNNILGGTTGETTAKAVDDVAEAMAVSLPDCLHDTLGYV